MTCVYLQQTLHTCCTFSTFSQLYLSPKSIISCSEPSKSRVQILKKQKPEVTSDSALNLELFADGRRAQAVFFLTFGVKKWIYFYSSLSTLLQQRAEVTSIVRCLCSVDCRLKQVGRCTSLCESNVTERKGDKKSKNENLW